jgi:serine/threonine protein kinase
MLYDIAAPLHHLHNNSIVHGDVKPTNMLLFNDHRIKLCDFGLSTVINSVGAQSTNGDQPRGTAGYIAREVIISSSSSITPISDVYSYGMVMYEVITGIKPYTGLKFDTICFKTVQGEHPAVTADSIYKGCRWVQPIMEKCWQHDAAIRPDFDEVLNAMNMGMTVKPMPLGAKGASRDHYSLSLLEFHMRQACVKRDWKALYRYH